MFSSANAVLKAGADALGGWHRLALPLACLAGTVMCVIAGLAANAKQPAAAQPQIDPDGITLFTPDSRQLAGLPTTCAQTLIAIAVRANDLLLHDAQRLTNTQMLTVARSPQLVDDAVRDYRKAKRNQFAAAQSALATALEVHERALREIHAAYAATLPQPAPPLATENH